MYNTNLGTMVGYFNYQGAQEIEQEGVLQTLYLMNPAGYPGYEATPNILLLNSAAAASVPPSLNPLLSHASAAPSTSNSMHQSLGIPLLPAPSHYISSSLQAFNSNQNPRLWSSAMPPHQLGLRQQQQQGLSLSLSPHHRAPIAASASSETGPSNGVSDAQRFWMGSRYLKVAQQLLEEVVSAGNEAKEGVSTKGSESKCHELRSAKAAEFGKNEKAASDLTTSERQDLHMKNVKLVSMLEEVEQRYKLYHHHIQTIVLSFEGATGSGAARTYTALALQTISKHFRWLKDVISAQIRGNAKRLLGEEAGSSLLGEDINKSSSGSRLRLIDQQLRQKRAFRMAQHNAWRPQRGLPECSVSILRAWLFEHFLHPYPKDSDKQLLAKQTGLTRSQVSNWFINARVRLWKPMVEEMYMEDQLKGGDITINIGDENSSSTSSSSSRSKNNTNYNGAESTSKSPPHELSALLPAQHSDTNMQQHSMKNMDFGVVMDGRDDDDDDEGELMIKFGMGLHDEKDIEDRRSLLQYGISGYSPMSRKLNGDDAYPGAGQAVERLISEELLLLTHPARTLMMNKQSVALTLGLPHHAAADDNNNNNNNNVRVQSFLSSTYCS